MPKIDEGGWTGWPNAPVMVLVEAGCPNADGVAPKAVCPNAGCPNADCREPNADGSCASKAEVLDLLKLDVFVEPATSATVLCFMAAS